jgi:DNA-binding beta-propeller fold protein YncE
VAGIIRVALFAVLASTVMVLAAGPVSVGSVTAVPAAEPAFARVSEQAHVHLGLSPTAPIPASKVPSVGPSGMISNATVAIINTTYNPQGLAYDNRTSEVFAPDETGVQVISAVTNRIVANISFGSGRVATGAVVYDSGKGEIFVPWFRNLTIINTTTNAIVANFTDVMGDWYGSASCYTQLPNAPFGGIAYDSEDGEVFLADSCGLSVISDTNNSLVATLPDTYQEACVAYDSGMHEIFTAEGNSAWVYSGPSFSTTHLIRLPYLGGQNQQECMAYDPAKGEVFVGQNWTGPSGTNLSFVSVISDKTNGIVANISTGTLPGGLAYDGVAGVVFVANAVSDNVSAIRDATNQVSITYPVVDWPSDVAFDPQANEIFVSNNGCFGHAKGCVQGSVSVISLRPSAMLTTSRPETDVNAAVSLSAEVQDVQGGPYSYRYTASNVSVGCAAASGPEVTCIPTISGSFNVSVNVTDAAGYSTVATSPEIKVYPALQTTFIVSNSTPLLGQTVAFVANPSGGLSPYSFNYTGFPPGCVSIDKPAVGCLPTQANYYNVTVHVTDQNNVTASATTEIHVIFDFNVVVPTNVSAGSPFTISVNANETFANGTAVVPAGGYGSLTYNYTGLPPGCASKDASSITCTPTAVGTYRITVSVHDQVGDHNAHTVVVNVLPAKSTPGVFGLSGDTGYFVVGGVVAVAAAAVALLVVRSRRSKRGNSTRTSMPSATVEPFGKTEESQKPPR